MSHRTFWQSHKCPTSPVRFLDISVTCRWKRKQPKTKRSIRILDQEFDGSTVLDKFRQRTHLCEARASAFPGQHCAVGQILVSLDLMKVNAIHSATTLVIILVYPCSGWVKSRYFLPVYSTPKSLAQTS